MAVSIWQLTSSAADQARHLRAKEHEMKWSASVHERATASHAGGRLPRPDSTRCGALRCGGAPLTASRDTGVLLACVGAPNQSMEQSCKKYPIS
jgi:hypothetical protein